MTRSGSGLSEAGLWRRVPAGPKLWAFVQKAQWIHQSDATANLPQSLKDPGSLRSELVILRQSASTKLVHASCRSELRITTADSRLGREHRSMMCQSVGTTISGTSRDSGRLDLSTKLSLAINIFDRSLHALHHLAIVVPGNDFRRRMSDVFQLPKFACPQTVR